MTRFGSFDAAMGGISTGCEGRLAAGPLCGCHDAGTVAELPGVFGAGADSGSCFFSGTNMALAAIPAGCAAAAAAACGSHPAVRAGDTKRRDADTKRGGTGVYRTMLSLSSNYDDLSNLRPWMLPMRGGSIDYPINPHIQWPQPPEQLELESPQYRVGGVGHGGMHLRGGGAPHVV